MSLLNGTGRHQAVTEGWWARRSRKGKVGIITLALLAIGGVAMAVFFIIAGQFSGTVTGGNWDVTLVGADLNTTETTADCTIAQDGVDPNIINITWNDAVPGDICVYRARFINETTSSSDVQYQSLPVPAGLQVYAFDGTRCGKTLPADGTTESLIANYLEFDGTQTNITFDATHTHQFVRPTEFDSANCDPVWTP